MKVRLTDAPLERVDADLARAGGGERQAGAAAGREDRRPDGASARSSAGASRAPRGPPCSCRRPGAASGRSRSSASGRARRRPWATRIAAPATRRSRGRARRGRGPSRSRSSPSRRASRSSVPRPSRAFVEGAGLTALRVHRVSPRPRPRRDRERHARRPGGAARSRAPPRRPDAARSSPTRPIRRARGSTSRRPS